MLNDGWRWLTMAVATCAEIISTSNHYHATLMTNYCETRAEIIARSCEHHANVMPHLCKIIQQTCQNHSKLMPISFHNHVTIKHKSRQLTKCIFKQARADILAGRPWLISKGLHGSICDGANLVWGKTEESNLS